MTAVKLTKAQRELLGRISDGQLLCAYRGWGDEMPPRWYVQAPYSNEDGRTVNAILRKGYIQYLSDGEYEISEAGRSALQEASRD